VNADDDTTFPDNGILLRGVGGGGQTPGVIDPTFPTRDRNDPVTRQRDYRLHDSVNVAKLNSFELNKTFRLTPRHYGSIVEPFFGFRYFGIDDQFRHDVYSRFDETTGALFYTTDVFGFFPPPAEDNVTIERLDSRYSQYRNHMFGGQIGLRWYKQKSRWNLSGEVRAFAVQNFQTFNTTFFSEQTQYGGPGPGDDVVRVLYFQSTDSGHANEFVFGTEIRAEAAYAFTRDVELRFGLQFMDFARGIGRGNNLLQNDQDMLMVGTTFGVAVNR
jgi:hypothetical protein